MGPGCSRRFFLFAVFVRIIFLHRSAGELLKTPRELWTKVLVMRSCRGSVMLNDPLPLEKLQYLLDTLFSLGAPMTCPHGRPIIHAFGDSEVFSWFGRK